MAIDSDYFDDEEYTWSDIDWTLDIENGPLFPATMDINSAYNITRAARLVKSKPFVAKSMHNPYYVCKAFDKLSPFVKATVNAVLSPYSPDKDHNQLELELESVDELKDNLVKAISRFNFATYLLIDNATALNCLHEQMMNDPQLHSDISNAILSAKLRLP